MTEFKLRWIQVSDLFVQIKPEEKQIKNMKMRESFRFFLNIYSREFRWRNSKKKQVKYDKKVSLSEPQVRMSRTIQ